MPVIYIRKTSIKEVANISRVRRVVWLIQYLKEWRTIKQCSFEIGIADRSVHRYLNLLINLGFIIETKHGKRNGYRISNLLTYFMGGWQNRRFSTYHYARVWDGQVLRHWHFLTIFLPYKKESFYQSMCARMGWGQMFSYSYSKVWKYSSQGG